MPGSLDALAQQYENVIEGLLKQTNNLITHYQNLLAHENYEADRQFIAEDIAATGNEGSISLTYHVSQKVLITSLLASVEQNQPASITIGRFTIPLFNQQSRINCVGPVAYVVGPGDIIRLSWSGNADGQNNYFAVFGHLIGSRFAQ